MIKLLAAVLLFAFLMSPKQVFAVVVAQQNRTWSDSLPVWQMIQELGDSLNGTADKFTFRVATSRTNLNQFDHTAENSKIYDKFNGNFYISGCVPAGSNQSDKLRGLTFTTSDVPAGFEDVTIDFSCNNYPFVSGHKYLIFITNANLPNEGTNTIFFGATSNISGSDLFTGGGLRYGDSNAIYDYINNGTVCDPVSYRWGGTDPWHNGCRVWHTPQDDIYFVLTNNTPPPPPPRLPVVFIPGIGGSEMKVAQDIVWSKDDGHGGTYSHAYAANEKVWVNQNEAATIGDDDYFDVLRLKTDGVNSEAPLNLTGNLSSYGYGDIDSFFTGMGYVKGTNFFVFPYDWRKDVRTNKDSLDALIEQAKTASGQTKANFVVHSMGGLIARYYISDATKASKVNKLIELGVPHLGTVFALKTLIYGTPIKYRFKFFEFPVIPGSEIKDALQNHPSLYSLTPSLKYYDFYNNSSFNYPYPFRDDRDIDNDQIKGVLNYDQTKNLLSNLSYNMTVFGLGEQFHSFLDPITTHVNGTKIYEIVGSNQPTLGQIHESWWITWPVNLIPKTDEIFINGDDTVPLYSASLKSDSLDISGAFKIYYVEQKHSDLVSANGSAMQTVRKILEDDNSLPVNVQSDKYTLDGKHISADGDVDLDLYDDLGNHTGLNSNGEIETNIPHSFYTTSGKTKHAFIKKKSPKVTVKVKSSTRKNINIRIRHYQSDSVTKTTNYQDVPTNTTPITFPVDPTIDAPPIISTAIGNVPPTEATGSSALDQTSPQTTIQIQGTQNEDGAYTSPATVTLTGNDAQSGIYKIECSLDNGQTVQTYTEPFVISTPGAITIQFRAIDNLGNSELPQSITITIRLPQPTPAPGVTVSSSTSSTSSGSNSNPNSNSTFGISSPSDNPISSNPLEALNNLQTILINTGQSTPLGIDVIKDSFENRILSKPIREVLGTSTNPPKEMGNNIYFSSQQILKEILVGAGIAVGLLAATLAFTFIKPTPE